MFSYYVSTSYVISQATPSMVCIVVSKGQFTYYLETTLVTSCLITAGFPFSAMDLNNKAVELKLEVPTIMCV